MSEEDRKIRVQAQLDSELVADANEVMNKLGLNPTTLITMTYQQLVNDKALPFKPTLNADVKSDVNAFVMAQFYNPEFKDFTEIKRKFNTIGSRCITDDSFSSKADLIKPFDVEAFDKNDLEFWQSSYAKGQFITNIILKITEPEELGGMTWSQSIMPILEEMHPNSFVIMNMGVEKSLYSDNQNEIVHTVQLFILDAIPWKRRQTNKLKRRLLEN